MCVYVSGERSRSFVLLQQQRELFAAGKEVVRLVLLHLCKSSVIQYRCKCLFCCHRYLHQCVDAGIPLTDAHLALLLTNVFEAFTFIQRGELSDVIANMCEMVAQMLPLPVASKLEPEEAKEHLLCAYGDFDLAVFVCVAKRREAIETLTKEFEDCERNVVLQVRAVIMKD